MCHTKRKYSLKSVSIYSMKKIIDKLQKAWNSLLYKLMFKNYV